MSTTTTQAPLGSPAIGLPPTGTVTLKINGVERQLDIAPWTTLLDALREYLDLTGTKKGCDHGQCGACTVLADGVRINSCLTLAVMKDGGEITTVEGLAQGEVLHPLQQAFIDHDAFQCGYCTPGQICSAAGLAAEGQAKTADDVRELMSGNLCRCGAYPQIAQAVCAVMAQDGEITTIEGLAGPDGALHPMQQAFVDHDAFQCGYCTPGQILSAVACVAEGHAGSDEEIREHMSGNLCRCAAYPNIVAAVRDAAAKMRA